MRTPDPRIAWTTLAVVLCGMARKATSIPATACSGAISWKVRSVSPARLKCTSPTFLPMLSAAVTRATSTCG